MALPLRKRSLDTAWSACFPNSCETILARPAIDRIWHGHPFGLRLRCSCCRGHSCKRGSRRASPQKPYDSRSKQSRQYNSRAKSRVGRRPLHGTSTKLGPQRRARWTNLQRRRGTQSRPSQLSQSSHRARTQPRPIRFSLHWLKLRCSRLLRKTSHHVWFFQRRCDLSLRRNRKRRSRGMRAPSHRSNVFTSRSGPTLHPRLLRRSRLLRSNPSLLGKTSGRSRTNLLGKIIT